MSTPLMKLIGDELYFMSVWQGTAHVYSLSLDENPKVKVLTSGEISIYDYCGNKDGLLIH